MRKQLRTLLKSYLREQLLQTRDSLGYTQEEMAHLLFMSTRSYAALESGQSCSGLITFLLFLLRCCPDPVEFLVKLTMRFDQCTEIPSEMIVSRQWIRRYTPAAVRFFPDSGDATGYPICPHCSAPISRDFQPYCANCTQTLDWSAAYRHEEALSGK